MAVYSISAKLRNWSIKDDMRGKKTPTKIIEQVKALAPLHDSISDLARQLNMPEQTVRDILRIDEDFVELRAQQKKKLILQATQKAEEFLGALNPDNAKSEMEKSIVFGTLIDKNAVLAGENSKWASQTFNIGDNRKIEIKVSPEAMSLVKRGKQIN